MGQWPGSTTELLHSLAPYQEAPLSPGPQPLETRVPSPQGPRLTPQTPLTSFSDPPYIPPGQELRLETDRGVLEGHQPPCPATRGPFKRLGLKVCSPAWSRAPAGPGRAEGRGRQWQAPSPRCSGAGLSRPSQARGGEDEGRQGRSRHWLKPAALREHPAARAPPSPP